MKISLPKIFISPANYIQAKDILFNSVTYLKRWGQKLAIVGDDNVYQLVGDRFIAYLRDNDFQVSKLDFGGEASPQAVQKAIDEIDGDIDFVAGIGGGKTLDTAKEIGEKLKINTIIIPTLASTDAPTSRLSVIYNEDGTFNSYKLHTKSPDLVLVDSNIIAHAPTKFLISGFGDALATYYEAQAVYDIKGFNNAIGLDTITSIKIAEASTETIFKYGAQALVANKQQVVTAALDSVIEANILMSGLGFENAGTSVAHTLQNSFPVLKSTKHLMHGEKVAFALLTQMFLQNAATTTINKYLHFFLSVGLPTTLADVGWEKATDEDLLKVTRFAAKPEFYLEQFRFDTSPEALLAAMRAADQYSKDYQNRQLVQS